jgi:hypothetical protein
MNTKASGDRSVVRARLHAGIAGLLALLLAAVVWGQERVEEPLSVEQAFEEAARADLVNRLVGYGRESGSALLLLGAVEVLDEMRAGVQAPGANGGEGKLYTRDDLLAEARGYAGEQAELLDVIADAEQRTPRWYYPRTCYYQWVWWNGYYQWRYICM